MTEDELQPREEVFRDNTGSIVAAIDRLGKKAEADQNLILLRENVDYTFVVGPGHTENLAPLAETLKANPDTQFVFSVGLTRSGKTVSAFHLVNEMNEKDTGSAKHISIEGADSRGIDDIDSVMLKIEFELRNEDRNKLSFVVIDEFGIFFKWGQGGKVEKLIDSLSQKYPRTTFMTIDVFGRNRGMQISAEVEEDPYKKYKGTLLELKKEGVDVAYHAHRDGWMHRSFEEAFFTLYHDSEALQREPELARLAAFELEAMCMGNPYILRRVIKIFEKPALMFKDGHEDIISQLTGADALRVMNGILVDTNRHVYNAGGRDIFLAYEESRIPYLREYMEAAFGGYRALDLLTKYARAGLHGTQAVPQENIDWSLFGKRI